MDGSTAPDEATEGLSLDGSGRYDAYHALWHLHAIGVVSDLETFASPAWDEAHAKVSGGGRRARVALIDTSVAMDHPNLGGALDEGLALDLFASPLGAPLAGDRSRIKALVAQARAKREPAMPDAAEAVWAQMLDHLDSDAADRPAASPSFSAHGTAMAGLIGARPLSPDQLRIAGMAISVPGGGAVSAGRDIGFAYAGVDPFCEIVPISTNFDVEPRQLIVALLYAMLIEADVVVLARDFPTPASLVSGDADPGRALGVDLGEDELADWATLDALVRALADRVLVVCAAGNDGGGDVLYPGRLAAPGNGIVAVGAHTAAGQPASYTPDAAEVTLYAPSGDGERLDEDMQRLDTLHPKFRAGDHGARYRGALGTFEPDGPATASTHTPLDLVSTDVPGRAGYNASPYADVFGHDGAVLDYRSAFCRFSGTSGAVGVAAGMAALACSAGRMSVGSPGDGARAKAQLVSSASDHAAATPKLHWSTLTAGA